MGACQYFDISLFRHANVSTMLSQCSEKYDRNFDKSKHWVVETAARPIFRHIHNIVEIPGCRNIGTKFKSQYFDNYNIMSEYWVVETAARIINPSISTTCASNRSR